MRMSEVNILFIISLSLILLSSCTNYKVLAYKRRDVDWYLVETDGNRDYFTIGLNNSDWVHHSSEKAGYYYDGIEETRPIH